MVVSNFSGQWFEKYTGALDCHGSVCSLFFFKYLVGHFSTQLWYVSWNKWQQNWRCCQRRGTYFGNQSKHKRRATKGTNQDGLWTRLQVLCHGTYWQYMDLCFQHIGTSVCVLQWHVPKLIEVSKTLCVLLYGVIFTHTSI